MAESRVINLHINAVDKTKVCETSGASKFFDAIGYLSTWNMTYPTVDIYIADSGEVPELFARYLDESGDSKYVIGAVWHGDHFGFHS